MNDYNITLDTDVFEIRIDSLAMYGYWEFRPMNGVGGKIWFGAAAPHAGEVLSGDGIPGGVAAVLTQAGYLVNEAFIIPNPVEEGEKERRRHV